jgi:hypothetical protein
MLSWVLCCKPTSDKLRRGDVRGARASLPAAPPPDRRGAVRHQIALAGLAPLVRALTFAHPHEDRLAFAVAWSTVLFVIVACLFLAVIDVIIVTRGGMREYRALRRETLGGRRSGEHEEPGNG